MALCEVTVKTAVNTRMALADRLAKKKPEEQRLAVIGSMHTPLESTYDIDYTASPVEGRGGYTQRTLAGSTGRFSLSVAPGPMVSGGKRNSGPFNSCSREVSSAGCGTSTDKESSEATAADGAGAQETAASAGDDAQPSASALPYRLVSHPSSVWESEAHAATRCVQPERRLDFFASVVKEERADDENRGGLAGATQRAVQICNKRATAPQMCPLAPTYISADPVELPLVAAHEKRLIARNYLDLVECEVTNPDTEQQLGYDQAPEGRLPGSDLSWALPVQSKAITHMGTSEDMFRGYPKYVDNRPVGYAGHVPSADRNLAAMHHGADARRLFAKAHMTLAVHGGGVDATVTSNNLRARHRGGKNAPAPKMLKPHSDEVIQQTVEGSMLQQTFHQTTEKERSINIRDDKQGKNYF